MLPLGSFEALAQVQSQTTPSHKVQAGETLYRISTTRGYSVEAVAKHNSIQAPFTLSVGQVIHFPPKASLVAKPRHEVPPAKPVQVTVSKPKAIPVVAPQSKPAPLPNTNAAIRATTGWQWPVAAKPVQDFGASQRGYSYELEDATKIVAATSGKVIYAKQGLGAFKHIVITTTPEGYVIAYEFNSDIEVEENSHIEKGQVIATISKPVGHSEPRQDAYSKFYFEVWKNGSTVNPKDIIGG